MAEPTPISTLASLGASPVIQNRLGAPHAPGHRFNKACDSCHISKVRCIPDPQSPIGTCKRCSKNGTSCVFSPVGPRRRPVRTKNDRIAELERRVKDMQIKLEKQVEKRSGTAVQPDASTLESASSVQASGEASETRPTSASRAGTGRDPGSSRETSPIVLATAAASTTRDAARTNLASHDPVVEGNHPKRETEGSTPPVTSTSPGSAATSGPVPERDLDVIDRGLLTEYQGDRLIQEFRSDLNGKYLGISLPRATSNSQLRRHRPAFWLSILCAASAGSPELFHLAPVLFSQLKKILDARMTPEAEPDLDALQALTNWAIFHNDPVFPMGEHVVETFSLAIQKAVAMADASALHCTSEDAPISDDDVSDEDVQLSRELLRWYWASFSLAIKRRQATMLRQTHLVAASLRILRTTQDQSDARLIQWIKLVQIAAEAVLALHQGHTQRADGLSDDARDGILDSFERQRKQWLVECPFHLVNEPLMLEYHSFVILVSEVIYPAGVADFKQRSYGLPSLSNTGEDAVPDRNFFASYKIRYTRKSITAARACLNLATAPAKDDEINSDLSPSTELLRRCGSFLHGRVFYALRLLLSVAHEAWRTKRYDIVDVDTLNIDAYILALRDRLEAASQKGRYRVPSLWLNALQAKIEPWWLGLRRLLERDRSARQNVPSEAAEEAQMSPSRAVGLPQHGSGSVKFQHPVASPYPASLENPLSPMLVGFPIDLCPSNPPLAISSNGAVSFQSFLDPEFLDVGLSTTEPCQGSEASVLPTTRLNHGLAESSREYACTSSNEAGDDAGNGDTVEFGAWSDGLDPFTFHWDSFDNVLLGSEMGFQPLPPYLRADDFEPAVAREQGNT